LGNWGKFEIMGEKFEIMGNLKFLRKTPDWGKLSLKFFVGDFPKGSFFTLKLPNKIFKFSQK